MKKQKRRAVSWSVCILAAILVIAIFVQDIRATDYPSKVTISDRGVTFTKSVKWEDDSHSKDNYRAEITLNAKGIDPLEYPPVDIAVLMCNSSGMFSPACNHPAHKTLYEDNSVRGTLEGNWDDVYKKMIPDNTGYKDENIADHPAVDFIVDATIGVKGYLIPMYIYTQDSGADYREAFGEVGNWHFVTEAPLDKGDRISLHMGEAGQPVAGILPNNYTLPGIYNLRATGQAAEKAGCNSGAAISTLGAKSFVDTVLKNNSQNRIALIPYGSDLGNPKPSFSNNKDELSKQIEASYVVSKSPVNTKLAFQAAEEIFKNDGTGRRRAVVFLSDDTIQSDRNREDAVKIADRFRGQGIETYVMGYRMSGVNEVNTYLRPFAFDYNADDPFVYSKYLVDADRGSSYGLVDAYLQIAGDITANKLYFTDYISEYFEVDKSAAGKEISVIDETITEGLESKTLQKVTAMFQITTLTADSAEIKIPVKLKDIYKTSKEFLRTNYDFAEGKKGASLEFWEPDGTHRYLGLDSVYLQPDSSGIGPDTKFATLHYDLQGGNPPEGYVLAPEQLVVGSKIAGASGYQLVPEKTGFKFCGWYQDRECSAPVGSTLMPERETTIYARWIPDTDVKLTYKLLGGSAPDKDVFQPEMLRKGTRITSAKDYKQIPVREGYLFDGWYLDSAYQEVVQDTFVLEEDTSIYAKWKQVKAKLIYMCYGGMLADGSSPEPEMVGIGTRISDAQGYNMKLQKKGFLFAGWYMDSEYKVPVGTNNMPGDTAMIYAKWDEAKTITIHLGGGIMSDGSTSLTVQVLPGTLVHNLKWYYSVPVKAGFQFGGWYKDEACTVPIYWDDLVTEDLKVYAKWLKQIYLNYDLQGGGPPNAGIFEPQSMEPESLISSAKDYGQKPVREGYQFQGWYLEAECKNPVENAKMPDVDKTIFAKWQEINLLYYDLQGGTMPGGKGLGPDEVAPKALVSSAPGYQETPEKEGFTFGGWYLEAECMNPAENTEMPDANMTIYAKWTPKEETPQKDDPQKDDPKKEDPKKDDPKKEVPKDKPKEGDDQKGADGGKPGKGGTNIKSGDSGNGMAENILLILVSGALAAGIGIKLAKKKFGDREK